MLTGFPVEEKGNRNYMDIIELQFDKYSVEKGLYLIRIQSVIT